METEINLGLPLENLNLLSDILWLLNRKVLKPNSLETIAELMKESTGFETVAIRIPDGTDFAFFLANDSSGGFMNPENSEYARNRFSDKSGRSDSCSLLESVCKLVTGGNADLSLPFFTRRGSFWTNNWSNFLATDHGHNILPLSRDKPMSLRYESVAIIPLGCQSEIIGVLQFIDLRKNRLSEETIGLFEAIAAGIGSALMRIRSEELLRQAEDELLDLEQRLEEQIEQRGVVEQELLRSGQRLELVMEAADLGSWDWNLNTDEVQFDRRWNTMLGYSLEETLSHVSTWQNRIHRDDKYNVLKTLRQHFKDPSRYWEAQYRLRSKSGDWRWILDRGKAVETDDSGNPVRMVGIYLDVTDLKRMEEELHDSAERFRGIFQSAKDGIFVKSSSLVYTHVNPAFAKIIGLSKSKIIGCRDADLYDQDASEILYEVDRRVLLGESIEQEQTRVMKGMPRAFLDTKIPMRNRHGDIIGIIGISREITDRKRTESFTSVAPTAESECRSAAMHSTLRTARLAAQTDAIVLLTGESGVGKDHLARYIHDQSKRAHGPFFSINCAAVSPELAESELFGYEPGAFTGARTTKRGLLELAEGGTILLNEIGDLTFPLQAKLLTFLDTRQFTRVGGTKLFTVNARLIAATNRDLEQDVHLNRFRQDLFYRLNVLSIVVPPLRQRTDDITSLASHMVAQLASKMGLDSIPDIDSSALQTLVDYPWPGNVRELRNVLERALILCDRRKIGLSDLAIRNKSQSRGSGKEWSFTVGFPETETINEVTMTVKHHLVAEALRRTRGKRKLAAKLLGISTDSLKYYVQLFGLHAISHE